MQQLKELGNRIKDTALPPLQNLEAQLRESGALPYLLSGGAGALVGGTLAAGSKRRGEGRLARLGRILGSAALAGAGTAGAHKLLSYGGETINNALPAEDRSPEQELLTGTGTRAALVGGAGLAMAGKTHLNDRAAWKGIAKAHPTLFGPWSSNEGFHATKARNLSKSIGGPNAYRNMVEQGIRPGAVGPGGIKYTVADYLQARRQMASELEALGISTRPGFRFMDKVQTSTLNPNQSRLMSRIARGLLKSERGMMTARNTMVPLLGKITGRSRLGMATRALGLTGAALFPEVAEGAIDAGKWTVDKISE